MGIEHLTVLFPTEVNSFDFQVECTDRTVQYKLNAQSLRLFGHHRDVNDAHRAGANRLHVGGIVKTYLSDDGLNSRDLFFKVLEPDSQDHGRLQVHR